VTLSVTRGAQSSASALYQHPVLSVVLLSPHIAVSGCVRFLVHTFDEVSLVLTFTEVCFSKDSGFKLQDSVECGAFHL
jgi:hypothetical protein